jgi:hypothetical protein
MKWWEFMLEEKPATQQLGKRGPFEERGRLQVAMDDRLRRQHVLISRQVHALSSRRGTESMYGNKWRREPQAEAFVVRNP